MSSKSKKLPPVAVCVHFPSNAMSVMDLGKGGVCLRRDLYKDDFAELNVGRRSTTPLLVSSHSLSRSLLSSSEWMDGIGFTSFAHRSVTKFIICFATISVWSAG